MAPNKYHGTNINAMVVLSVLNCFPSITHQCFCALVQLGHVDLNSKCLKKFNVSHVTFQYGSYGCHSKGVRQDRGWGPRLLCLVLL